MKSAGFSLVETLAAMAILALLLAGVFSTFFVMLAVNTRNEERSGAVAVAQQTMEQLRQQDPATMPESGAVGPQLLSVDDREYEVTSWYCLMPQYCDDDSRHVLIEVDYGGRTFFSAESVYTQLR